MCRRSWIKFVSLKARNPISNPLKTRMSNFIYSVQSISDNYRYHNDSIVVGKLVQNSAPGLDASPIIFTPSATTVQSIMSESLANEDVFEITNDSLAVSIQNHLQTLEDQKTLRKTLRKHLGPLSQKYIGAILTSNRESDMDHMYGVYLEAGMMFNSKRFDVDKADNIIIDSVRYVGTYRTWSLRVDLQESPR